MIIWDYNRKKINPEYIQNTSGVYRANVPGVHQIITPSAYTDEWTFLIVGDEEEIFTCYRLFHKYYYITETLFVYI